VQGFVMFRRIFRRRFQDSLCFDEFGRNRTRQLKHRLITCGRVFLRQISNRGRFLERNLAFIRRRFAQNEREERRFPRPVRPDEPDAIRAQFAQLRARATVRGKFGTGGIQAMKRSFLVEVRGYDEDMLWWGALDTDLVRRAEAAGLHASWVTDRTAMLHQWHPRKHHILDESSRAQAARGSWQRNHELMYERRGHVVRNHRGWGAAINIE